MFPQQCRRRGTRLMTHAASPSADARGQRRGQRTRPGVERLEDRLVPSGDVVLQWNETLLDAVRTARTSPPMAARNMAIVQVAIYDAVNSIDGSYAPYLFRTPGPGDARLEAAAAQAGHDTLLALYPAQSALFEQALQASLAAIPDGPAESKGIVVGKAAAAAILAARQNDGSAATVPYTPGTGPGA